MRSSCVVIAFPRGFGKDHAKEAGVVEFRVLGPVEVLTGDRPLPAGEPRRLAVLAALVVDAGQVVGVDTLVQRVWGEQAPESAASTLRAHVTRIRRMLDQAPSGAPQVTVVSRAGGYVLLTSTDQVDMFRFQGIVERARAVGDAGQRAEMLRSALALWRGDPLTGVSGEWATRTRERLIEERLAATVAWAEAELAVGGAAPLVASLGELASQYPLMEPLVAAHLRALVAAGRPTEALERCRLHRERLAADFGTDQGPELRALYQEVLCSDAGQAFAHGQVAAPGGTAPGGTQTPELPEVPPAEVPAASPEVRPAAAPEPVRICPEPERPSEVVRPPAPEAASTRSPRRRGVLLPIAGMAVLLTVTWAAAGARWSSTDGSHSPTPAGPDPSAAAGPWTEVTDFTGDLAVDRQWNAMERPRDNGSSWSQAMVRFDGGELRLLGVGRNPSGQGNQSGAACWCSRRRHAPIRTYGVWETRMKFDVGGGYAVIAGLWPNDGKGPFITLLRSDDAGRRSIYAEFGDGTGHQAQTPVVAGDFTDWNTFTVEWRKDFVTLALNGRVFADTRTLPLPVTIPDHPMHLYVQMVSGPEGPVPGPGPDTPSTVTVHLDWARYRP